MKRTSFEALSTLALYGLSTSRRLDCLKVSMKVVRCQLINVPRASMKIEPECSRDAERMARGRVLQFHRGIRPYRNPAAQRHFKSVLIPRCEAKSIQRVRFTERGGK